MSNFVNTIFVISALVNLSVYSSNAFMPNRVLQETALVNKQQSDETMFGMLSVKSILTHYNFVARKVNEATGESFYEVSNQCSTIDDDNLDTVISSCSVVSWFNNQNSNKFTQQDLVFNDKISANLELDTTNATLKISGVESRIINKENGNIVSEKVCKPDVYYSFLNTKAQRPFAFMSDNINDLAVQIRLSGGDCGADNVTPLLNMENKKADSTKIYGYVAFMVFMGLIQAITCGVLVIQIDKNNNCAKQASLGTLCFLISFDFFIYLQHFTYWTTISNLMIIVFVLFFMLSVFFEPALLYFVFSTLQRRHNVSIRALLFQLYFWLVFSAIGIMIAKTYLSNYILYTIPLCLVPQIFDSMYNKQKYKWNFALLGGLVLPKMAYLAVSSLNLFDLFHAKPNPSILVFAGTAIALQLVVLKIQTRWPGLGIVKKSNQNLYSYECQKDEIETVSAVICSICTEKVGLSPIIGQQPDQDQESSASEPVMKTPCLHYYHESCLKEWFKKKFECPNCRQMLPPLENEDDE